MTELIKFPPSNTQRASLVVTDGELQSLVFSFPINPASFTDNHSANYVDHAVIGRSHPKSMWVNSGNRAIGFTLNLDARSGTFNIRNAGVVHRQRFGAARPGTVDLVRRDVKVPEIEDKSPTYKLMRAANFLRALTKPRIFERDRSFEGEIYTGPPPVLFCWGPYFRVRCIVRSVEMNWQQFDSNLVPLRATATVSLTEQPTRPVSFQDYASRGDQRETLDTLGDC